MVEEKGEEYERRKERRRKEIQEGKIFFIPEPLSYFRNVLYSSKLKGIPNELIGAIQAK